MDEKYWESTHSVERLLQCLSHLGLGNPTKGGLDKAFAQNPNKIPIHRVPAPRCGSSIRCHMRVFVGVKGEDVVSNRDEDGKVSCAHKSYEDLV